MLTNRNHNCLECHEKEKKRKSRRDRKEKESKKNGSVSNGHAKNNNEKPTVEFSLSIEDTDKDDDVELTNM